MKTVDSALAVPPRGEYGIPNYLYDADVTGERVGSLRAFDVRGTMAIVQAREVHPRLSA
jgi:hypothetical protein